MKSEICEWEFLFDDFEYNTPKKLSLLFVTTYNSKHLEMGFFLPSRRSFAWLSHNIPRNYFHSDSRFVWHSKLGSLFSTQIIVLYSIWNANAYLYMRNTLLSTFKLW